MGGREVIETVVLALNAVYDLGRSSNKTIESNAADATMLAWLAMGHSTQWRQATHQCCLDETP